MAPHIYIVMELDPNLQSYIKNAPSKCIICLVQSGIEISETIVEQLTTVRSDGGVSIETPY